jgi:hypothetical protein
MDLREEILLDLVLETDLPVSEMAMFVTPGVKRYLRETPKVSKKEFLEATQPGDIMVTFTPKRAIKKSLYTSFKAKMMTLFQASPYTSSKLVYDKNSVAGYDADPTVGKNYLQKGNLQNFVNRWIQEAMLIRPVGTTPEQIRKVQAYFKKRFGLPYNSDQVMLSAWKRFYKKVLPFLRQDDSPPPEKLQEMVEPLFCSNIIAVAYRAAGYNNKFGKVLFDTWPRDFILSPHTQKICRIEYI